MICDWCGQNVEGIYIGSHLQCDSCKQVLEPCCSGKAMTIDTKEKQSGVCDTCKHLCHCGNENCAGPENCQCKDCSCGDTKYWIDEELKPYAYKSNS